MASAMAFDIFARDHASRVFDKVGDNAERLGRRIDGAGRSTGGLGDNMRGLDGAAGGLGRTLVGLTVGMAGAAAKAVLVAGGLATLAGGAAAAASSLVGLTAALAPVGGLVAALPGLLASAAAGMVVWKLATGGLGEAMGAAMSGNVEALSAALGKLSSGGQAFIKEFEQAIPILKGFKSSAQDAFIEQISGRLLSWAVAARALKTDIAELAAGMGGLVRTTLDFATAPASLEQFSTILRNTRTLLDGLWGSLDPLLKGFLDLATVGSNWLAGMSGGMESMLTRFGEWMSRVSASGQALAWMDGALVVLKQFGAIVGDLGGIIMGVLRAAQSGGQTVLGVFGSLLDGLHAFVDSAKGQEALKTVFQALGEVGRALLPVITALAGGIAILAPHIAQLAQIIGPILTTAVNALAPALAKLGPALVTVFTELGSAVQTLASGGALDALATGIGALLAALAPLLPALAQLLVPVLQLLATLVTTAVAPALAILTNGLKQAVDWLTGAGLSQDSWLMKVINLIWEKAMPVWKQIGDLLIRVFNDVTTWVQNNQGRFQEWGDRIISIVSSVGDTMSGVWQFISIAWEHFGSPLLDRVGDIFGGILRVIDGVMTAIKGIVNIVLGLITGDWDRAWNGVKQTFQGVWDAIVGILETVVGALRTQFLVVEKYIAETWPAIWNGVKNVFQNTWNAITSWFSDRVNDIRNMLGRLGDLPGQVAAWFGQVRQAIVDRFNDAVAFVQTIPGRITSALSNMGSLLVGAGRDLVVGFWNGIVSMWNWLVSNVQNLFGGIAEWAKRVLGIASPSKVFAKLGRELPAGMALGIEQASGLVKNAVDGLAGMAKVNAAMNVGLTPTTGAAPITPAGTVNVFNFSFAGQPLVGQDEIYRMMIGVLNEAKGRGFNLGFA